MLTKRFGTRSTRSLNKDYSYRPCLESLEERNAPSGGPGGDHDHGPPPPHHPPPPPASVNTNTSVAVANNAHGSFNNSTFTNSFNTTITNNIAVNLMPGQALEVSGLLGLSNFLSTALSNPQLGTLLTDEILAAVDSYLTTPAISTVLGLSSSTVDTLTSDLGKLEQSITTVLGTPPSPILSAIGAEVFTLTMNALTSPQATI